MSNLCNRLSTKINYEHLTSFKNIGDGIFWRFSITLSIMNDGDRITIRRNVTGT